MSIYHYTVEKEIVKVLDQGPAVSIILPFEPKMIEQQILSQQLQRVVGAVEQQLFAQHAETATAIIEKIKAIIKSLDYNTHKKSVAIFVSEAFEKVYYLDVPVVEKIIVDSRFKIRNLVYQKKELFNYLLVVLGEKKARIFLGNKVNLVRLVTNYPGQVTNTGPPATKRPFNFTHPSLKKEILLKKFLKHVDNGLYLLLKTYPYPLFVLAAKEYSTRFRQLSRNEARVTGYIYGECQEATEEELLAAMLPHLKDWQKIKSAALLRHLETALNKQKLSVGIKEVWAAVQQKKGNLLVVEKDYVYPADFVTAAGANYLNDVFINNALHIKDAVDMVIEKVLEEGGEVEFIAPGYLKDYLHIALIHYY